MLKNLASRMQDISPFYVMELLQRAKQLELQGRDIIHLEIGEPDFDTPPEILAASLEHIKAGHTKYTSAAGLPELREKIAQYYRDNYNVIVSPQRIFITPGASGAFILALGATLNPGEDILLADPCYPCNSNFIKLFGGIPVFIPVTSKTNYQLNVELINKHWSANCKGILIASPSNPTGTMISEQDLKSVVSLITEKQRCFYSDEIYHGLVYGKRASTALAASDQVFVINSFSKYFGMTGWRIGWLVVPEEFINPVEKLIQNIFISAPTPSQFAALAAFSKTNLEELEERKEQFSKRKGFLSAKLQQLGFVIKAKPEGAFYIYVDCSEFSNDSFQFAKELLQEEGVAITPGKDFGHHRANTHLRFSYTAPLDKIEEGINRLEQFLKKN